MRMLYLRVPAEDLDQLEADPDLAARWFADEDPLDLGHSWHGIHVLLNGSAWGGTPPLYDAVLGGTPLGEPTSYEPIRFVSGDEVAAVAEALPTEQELVPRFTHRAMKQAEAFPDQAWEEADALTTFLLPPYQRLVAFFAAAAAAGDAVLITLDRS